MSGVVAAPATGGASSATPAPTNGGSATNGTSSPSNGLDASATKPNVSAGQSATPPPKPETPQRFKYKSKDAEIDMDPADVWREIQKSRHFDKTRGEWENQRKAFEQQKADFEARIQELQADPIAYMEKVGVQLEQIAQAKAARDAELNQLPPEIRDVIRRNQELEGQLKKTQEAQAAREAEEARLAEERATQELVQSNVRAIDSAIRASGLKRSGELVKLYAEVIEMAERNGEPPLSTEQLVMYGEKLRSQRYFAGMKETLLDPAWRSRNMPAMKELAAAIFANMEGPELVEFVGRQNAAKMARESLNAYRKNPLPTVAEATPIDATPPPARGANTFSQPESMHAILDKLASR